MTVHHLDAPCTTCAPPMSEVVHTAKQAVRTTRTSESVYPLEPGAAGRSQPTTKKRGALGSGGSHPSKTSVHHLEPCAAEVVHVVRGAFSARNWSQAMEIGRQQGWSAVIFSHRLRRCTGFSPAEVDDILLSSHEAPALRLPAEPPQGRVKGRAGSKARGGSYVGRDGEMFWRVTVAPGKRKTGLIPGRPTREEANRRASPKGWSCPGAAHAPCRSVQSANTRCVQLAPCAECNDSLAECM